MRSRWGTTFGSGAALRALSRARRMAKLGLIQMIHPRDLSAELLARKVLEALSLAPQIPFVLIRFSAVEKLAEELGHLIREDSRFEPPVSKEVTARG